MLQINASLMLSRRRLRARKDAVALVVAGFLTAAMHTHAHAARAGIRNFEGQDKLALSKYYLCFGWKGLNDTKE